jgi:hypothetical protein
MLDSTTKRTSSHTVGLAAFLALVAMDSPSAELAELLGSAVALAELVD